MSSSTTLLIQTGFVNNKAEFDHEGFTDAPPTGAKQARRAPRPQASSRPGWSRSFSPRSGTYLAAGLAAHLATTPNPPTPPALTRRAPDAPASPPLAPRARILDSVYTPDNCALLASLSNDCPEIA